MASHENLGAARALVRMMGGLEAMVESGTHLTDVVDRVMLAPNIDPTSLRQLNELAAIMGIAPDGTHPDDDKDDFHIRWVDMRPKREEPIIEPEVARHWLLYQTHRAIEQEDGSIRLRPDQKPDHLGFAAMVIAKGDEPRLFSDVYAEVTDTQSPIAPEIISTYAQNMVRTFFEEAGK